VVNANCVVLQAAREIAIACEDLVTGTVTAVDASGVTVSYTLSDGTPVQVSQPTRRGGGGGYPASHEHAPCSVHCSAVGFHSQSIVTSIAQHAL
jgi:hypothetical protein